MHQPLPFPNQPHALLFAAKSNNVAQVEQYLATVPVDATERDKATALHFAAGAGAIDAMRVLMAHGADMNAPDSKLRSPLQWAIISQQAEAVSLLLQNTASTALEDKYGNTPLWTCLFSSGKVNFDILRSLLTHGNHPQLDEAYTEAQRAGYTEVCAVIRPFLSRM